MRSAAAFSPRLLACAALAGLFTFLPGPARSEERKSLFKATRGYGPFKWNMSLKKARKKGLDHWQELPVEAIRFFGGRAFSQLGEIDGEMGMVLLVFPLDRLRGITFAHSVDCGEQAFQERGERLESRFNDLFFPRKVEIRGGGSLHVGSLRKGSVSLTLFLQLTEDGAAFAKGVPPCIFLEIYEWHDITRTIFWANPSSYPGWAPSPPPPLPR